MGITSVLLLSIFMLCNLSRAHEACNNANFQTGSQHADCDYAVPEDVGVANATERQWDIYWLTLIQNYTLQNMPALPWGAAIVDSRTNTLVSIGTNMFYSDHPIFSHQVVSHAETVVITNATIYSLPDTWNPVTQRRKPHPDWKYMTLYGNIEACPMCAQGAIWRGLRRMVFGARATALGQKRCWSQPKLTAHEVADQNSHFATFSVIRGPFPELEDWIISGFAQYCPTPTSAPPPPFSCNVDYTINNQPPSWPTGMSASLSVTVSDTSKLAVNGKAGWSISFTAKGTGNFPPFEINSIWNAATPTNVSSPGKTVYTIGNLDWNSQNPTNIGFNAKTTIPSPYNNICGVSINGVSCSVSSTSAATASC